MVNHVVTCFSNETRCKESWREAWTLGLRVNGESSSNS